MEIDVKVIAPEQAQTYYMREHPVILSAHAGGNPMHLALSWEEAETLRNQLDAVLKPDQKLDAHVLVCGETLFWRGRKFANNDDGKAILSGEIADAGLQGMKIHRYRGRERN